MRVAVQRRWLCSSSTDAPWLHQKQKSIQWSVKQVTKSNFGPSVEQMSSHISASDFVAVSLQKTGSFSAAPWHRPLPFDTAAAAYSKAKFAAERFHLFQLALCPFSLKSPSKLVAHPYNYLLFPREELKSGLPSYSFSCQSSYLTSMANEGFDFNACIYEGLSYVSRAQESGARIQMGNLRPGRLEADSDLTLTVADSVFVERIRTRIVNWKNTCKKKKEAKNDSLLGSLGKIILAGQYHGDRPCTDVDVCTERQVQLALQVLKEFSNELVPLIVPGKSGGTQAVRVVFTSSEKDKKKFENELLEIEVKERKQVQGFREVIDLISASQKPLVSYNSLTDFTFIYSKFIGPLPPTVDEFASSLHEVFPNVVDVSHLMKLIDPMRKMTNIPLAISYLNNHFSAPVDVQIPQQATENDGCGVHGHNVVRICHLFAKLCSILKISRSLTTPPKSKLLLYPALEEHSNVFGEFSSGPRESASDQNVTVWTKSTRRVSRDRLVFLWGFGTGTTAGKLKRSLEKSGGVFAGEFDVRLVDKSCAVVVFWEPGLAETFLGVLNNDSEIDGSLREMVFEGLRAASYETYLKACDSAVLEIDLGVSLDNALGLEYEEKLREGYDLEEVSEEIHWCGDSNNVDLNEL